MSEPWCVELLERIARFHILCEYELCDDQTEEFVSFQNVEQLNKCLISLRQFYDDLGRRRGGHFFEHEAEFRGYFLLTHIHDAANIRLYISETPEELLHTREIQFVLRVWNALDCCDYYQFFRLLAAADYLTACVMHSLFNQVRAKAMEIMNRVYVS